MSYDRIMFIGCFSLDFYSNGANSPAANQVQIEIINAIKKEFTKSDVVVSANKPQRTWPYSKLFQRSQVIEKYKFQGYLNFLVLKDLVIYFRHFGFIINYKPNVIFKYNTTIFESLFLFCVKKIFKIKIVVVLQDVSYQYVNSNFIKKHLEIYALKLCSNFDVQIPITKDFLKDFSLNQEKCIVFQGGMTFQSKALMSIEIDFERINNSKYFVYAGALEEYNGIKSIVDYWVNNDLDFDLHIYGKGSFENYVIECVTKTNNIKYFGFKDESIIINDQISAFGNFCFRNSKGINQKYFFPSKFFNVLACPGRVFVNDFENIPETIKSDCYILNEDLSNVKEILALHKKNEDVYNYNSRLKWLLKYADWSYAINLVKNKLDNL